MHGSRRAQELARGLDWVAQMPDAVARQRRALRDLLAAVSRDERVRWLELGGSLARNAGDELSDIDSGIGVEDDAADDGTEIAVELAAQLGQVVDRFVQRFPHGWHTFTLFDDGLQLSLVTMAATTRPGLPPQSVSLYDLDAQLARPWQPESIGRIPRRCGSGWLSAGWPSAIWRSTSTADLCGRHTRSWRRLGP